MSETAILARYRAVVADLQSASGALQVLERRRSDLSLQIAQLRVKRDAVPKPRLFVGGPPIVPNSEELDRSLSQSLAEAARLADDAVPLQQRRNTASSVACRCRDLLIDRRLLHPSDAGF